MAATPTSRILRPTLTSAPSNALLAILAPPVQCSRAAPVARFSTSPASCKDNNKLRGLSPVRHTGLRRKKLSVSKNEIPKPVPVTKEIEGDPDHGLWGFFRDKKLFRTPSEEYSHGRAWAVAELRDRDWESLHKLWWVCAKERNRLATEKLERERQDFGFGDRENEDRDKTVQETMKAIIGALVERDEAHRKAFELARKDPTIDLSRPEHQYQEDVYSTEELYDEDPMDEPPEMESKDRPREEPRKLT